MTVAKKKKPATKVIPANTASRADQVYLAVKQDIFDFRLLPGDSFTESQVAERMEVSRTPVREALFRLERDGYLQVHFRSGWSVKPFDFQQFEDLYDLRLVLESAAIKKLCEQTDPAGLEPLKKIWLVSKRKRLTDEMAVSVNDEQFHMTLVCSANNPEIARVHSDVMERIRIIRRLDFTQPHRIENTYDEHGQILEAIAHHRADQAIMLLRAHIEASKAEVRKITLHRLHTARQS
ncbi:MAG TPA: GntR family transcriptional regulator [Burkholderiaceae bacterium]|jgi:DNA-binding GntR family transcriptional regulator